MTQTSYVDAGYADMFAHPCSSGRRYKHSPVEDVHSGLEFRSLSRPLTLLGSLHVLVLLTVAERLTVAVLNLNIIVSALQLEVLIFRKIFSR